MFHICLALFFLANVGKEVICHLITQVSNTYHMYVYAYRECADENYILKSLESQYTQNNTLCKQPCATYICTRM